MIASATGNFSVRVLDNGAVLVGFGQGEDYGRALGKLAAFEDRTKAKEWLMAQVSDEFEKAFVTSSNA